MCRDGLVVRGGFPREDKVRINLSRKSKRDAMELRVKLEGERDMVMRRIESNEGKRNGVQVIDGSGSGSGTSPNDEAIESTECVGE